MYVPSQPGIVLRDLFSAPANSVLPFPFNALHKTFSYMARNVIYHLFRTLNLERQTVVLVPDYHSGAEVWAMKAAGAKIKYYPIKRNLEPDMDALARLCTAEVHVLYVIHYLGWAQPMRALMSLCQARGITLIEDCALALHSEVDGQALGTFGDYAIFCLHKSLPVPHGGLLIQNRNVLQNLDCLAQEPCTVTSLAARSTELFLQSFRSRANVAGKVLLGMKRVTGRVLDRVGIQRLPVGDMTSDFISVGFELSNMNFEMAPFCRRILERQDYNEIRRKRRRNYLLMHELLAEKVSLVFPRLGEGVCPLFFPILVPDKHAAACALREHNIDAIEFWNYGYPDAKQHSSEAARFYHRHMLELPIHQDITENQIEYTAQQVLALKAVSASAIELGNALNTP